MQCAIDHRRAPLPASIRASLLTEHAQQRVPAWVTGAAALAIVLGGCGIAHATGYAVTGNGDPGTGGLSLRQAITMANAGPGNIVYFDPALNGSTITLSQGEIAITNSTTILGPGAGKLTISGANSSRIFSVDAQTPVTISGLTLTAGNASSASAIYASRTPLTLQDCVVSGNSQAAAIHLYFASTSQISNCTIANNTAGGIYSDRSIVAITNSHISGNSKTGNGAGIYGASSQLNITNSVISGNSASGDGGGISVREELSYTTKLSLIQSSVSGNNAYNFGAGIDIKVADSVYIDQSLISGNVLTSFSGSGYGGGGIALRSVSGLADIYNSTFYHNFAYHNGGGIGIFDAASGTNTRIRSSTISGNSTAYFYSNGIFALGKPTIYSSIVANNASKLYTQDLVGTFSVGASLIKNPNGATVMQLGPLTNMFGVDPQLGPLAVNGGPTLTMLPAATSPVVNALPFSRSTDQRGLPTAGSGADMGAVERQVPEVIIFRNGFDSS